MTLSIKSALTTIMDALAFVPKSESPATIMTTAVPGVKERIGTAIVKNTRNIEQDYWRDAKSLKNVMGAKDMFHLISLNGATTLEAKHAVIKAELRSRNLAIHGEAKQPEAKPIPQGLPEGLPTLFPSPGAIEQPKPQSSEAALKELSRITSMIDAPLTSTAHDYIRMNASEQLSFCQSGGRISLEDSRKLSVVARALYFKQGGRLIAANLGKRELIEDTQKQSGRDKNVRTVFLPNELH